MTPYNPFSANFDGISVEHLTALREIAEGWFVEYKALVPTPTNIAKSVSAFANHEGGWLVIGVKCHDSLPEAFPGILSGEVEAALKSIRNSCNAHISPVPHFDMRAIHGPSATLDLPSNSSLILVHVPRSQSTPHIHSNGRIYRRVGAGSEPVAETNSEIVYRLTERRQRLEQELADWVATPFKVSEEESHHSWAHIFLTPWPSRSPERGNELTLDEFATIARREEPVCTPFDTVFSSAKGFVARQVGINRFDFRSMTWEFGVDGRSVVTFAVPGAGLWAKKCYKHLDDFRAVLGTKNYHGICDLNAVAYLLASAVDHHIKASEAFGYSGSHAAKIRIDNIWRKIPFLDTEGFIKHTTSLGVPLVQDTQAFVPPTKGEFIPIAAADHVQDLTVRKLTRTISLNLAMFDALGLPREIVTSDGMALVDAAERALVGVREEWGK